MAAIAAEEPGVSGTVQFAGMSSNGFASSSSAAVVFYPLDSFKERKRADLSANAILARLNQKLSAFPDAMVHVIPAPAVQGLGNKGGFRVHIEDRDGQGPEALQKVIDSVLQQAWRTPELAGVYTYYEINAPQLNVKVDRVRAKQQNVQLTDVFQTLQVYLGSLYVNDFNAFGRTYRVMAQADAPFRLTAEDILKLKTRNAFGEMVPLSSVVTVEQTFGPDIVERFNGYPAGDINGAAAPGYSSGEAQAALEKILQRKLPPGFAYEWTELAFQQQAGGNTAFIVFPLCVLFVFLVLAAQYESLRLPLAIVLIVPLGVLAGLVGVFAQRGDINIFTQVGFMVLVALACKNAILIVEFATHLQEQGRSAIHAVLEAARLRLRPILMTSFAFIMGVVPLVFATGAGAEVRSAMGAVVFAGMIGVTFFGLLLTPVFYVVLQRRRAARAATEAAPSALEIGHA